MSEKQIKPQLPLWGIAIGALIFGLVLGCFYLMLTGKPEPVETSLLPADTPVQSATPDLRPTPVIVEENRDEIYNARYRELAEAIIRNSTEPVIDRLSQLETDYTGRHDRAFQGLIFAVQGRHEKAASLLTQAVRDMDLPPTHSVLVDSKERWGLSLDEIDRKQFDINDSDYIQSTMTLQQIAGAVVAGCTNDIDRADRLLNWVFCNVFFQEPENTPMNPLDILLRGYGLCDRSVWVFCLLAQRAGLPATSVVLFDPQTQQSIHTIAQVLVDRDWLLCDTTHGTFLTRDGKFLTLVGIWNYLDSHPDDGDFQEKYKDFRHAMVSPAYMAEGLFPRMSLLEPYVKLLPLHSSVYYDVEVLGASAATCLPDAENVDRIGLWDFPFFLRISMRDPVLNQRRNAVMQRITEYRTGRSKQLLGRYDDALKWYTGVAPTASPEAKEDMLYFSAQCYQGLKQYEAARETYLVYLYNYPEGRWRPMAIYQLAQVEEALGHRDEALELYKQLPNIAAAKSKAGLLFRESVVEQLQGKDEGDGGNDSD